MADDLARAGLGACAGGELVSLKVALVTCTDHALIELSKIEKGKPKCIDVSLANHEGLEAFCSNADGLKPVLACNRAIIQLILKTRTPVPL